MAWFGRWLALSVIGGVALLLALSRWGEAARAEERSGRERIFLLMFIVTGVLAGAGPGAWLSAQARTYGYFG